MKKRIAALLAALMILLPLASCAGREAPAVTVGRTVVTAPMYHYFASSYKAIFSYTYSDYADKQSFWDKEMEDGSTVREYLDALVLQYVKRTAAAADLCDTLGLRLPDEKLDGFDKKLDDLEDIYADGSRNAFNSLLASYGVNRSILRDIYIMEAKVELLENALFAAGGALEITNAVREQYYREHYTRVRIILIGDTYRYKTDEDGHFVTDATGHYVTETLSEEEKAEKQAKITALDEKLAAGEDFEALEQEFSEAALFYGEDGVYPNGYYLTTGTSFVSEVTDLAGTLEEGAVGKCSTDYGTFFLKRLPLDEGAYAKAENADFFTDFDSTVKEDAYIGYLAPTVASAVADTDVIEPFSLPYVTPNFRF